MLTRDSLHSFSIPNKLLLKELLSFCVGVPEPSLSVFMPNTSFSPSPQSAPFFTHGHWLDSPPHSASHLSSRSGV